MTGRRQHINAWGNDAKNVPVNPDKFEMRNFDTSGLLHQEKHNLKPNPITKHLCGGEEKTIKPMPQPV